MNYILFDDDYRDHLLPLTYTRPVADMRVGILTIREKWEQLLGVTTSTFTQEYLSGKYPLEAGDDNLLINGAVLPNDDLVKELGDLEQDQKLVDDELLIAVRCNRQQLEEAIARSIPLEKLDVMKVRSNYENTAIRNLWDIFTMNGEAIETDFTRLTDGKQTAKISDTNTVLGNRIYVEEGATIECATLNSTTGPIYIGKDAGIMEGSHIRGPFALCNNAVLKMAARIYGPTTIGPHCKVGGEVNNSVIFGYSNKSHDGFLGNSVIGEWCNLGADTNNSNLKNNYAEVKLWNYPAGKFGKTGLQFCGLVMGDHSKCSINTMFNTGTVIGVSANIFGSGFPRNFVPSFSWGGNKGFTTYALDKAIDVAEHVMKRRNVDFDRHEQAILTKVFELTTAYRDS